jgi:cell division protein ZapA (FtsZ GTPase activity inhibitor)
VATAYDEKRTKRSVTVEVAGQKFQLKTDADEAYVKSLAEFVSDKIGEARTAGRTFSTHALAILAALHIADDLFQTRRDVDAFRKRVRDKSHVILELLDQNETRSGEK